MGPSSSYSVAVDIDGNVVPFGFNQLMGVYTLTNSEGIVARVGSYSNTQLLKPGEQVSRQPIVVLGFAPTQVYFLETNCDASIAYVPGGGAMLYTSGNGVAAFVGAPAVNTMANVNFYRYDMTVAPILNLPVRSFLQNGVCSTPTFPPAPIASALTVDKGASLSFLNALWPVAP